MGDQCHVVAVGIGTEIGPQCGYHVVFSHEFDRRNRQFFDVLCGRQQHCGNVIPSHSLHTLFRQLHRLISTYSRWLTPSAPTSYAINPDYRLLSSSPWKLGISPSCLPACMMRVLLFLQKNFLSQKTSINLGHISPRSHASFTAGSWEWMTSWVCSSSVFPLGMAWAPQKVAITSIVPFICWRTISIARSIFTSASALSPYPDLTSTVVVPSRLILRTYLVRCATRDSRGDWLIFSVVYLMPRPSLQISTQFFPFSFMSNSRERSPANKACVCASTSPGSPTRTLQSFSLSKDMPSSFTHWETSSFGPTLDITPA